MSENETGMPLLLRLAMVVGAVVGTVGTVGGLWALLHVVTSEGPFHVTETPIAKADFLKVAAPFLVLYVSACLTAGAASLALWRRRARSRALLVVLLAEFVVGDAAMLAVAGRTTDVAPSELAVSALVFTLLVALGLWYLFRKDSVVRYYRSVRPS